MEGSLAADVVDMATLPAGKPRDGMQLNWNLRPPGAASEHEHPVWSGDGSVACLDVR